MNKEMETFDARLASFDLVLHPGKQTSGAKAAKPISWPRNGPSPAEMAHAGFYYNPYETNPDNTTCFLCERSLDGWDGDDNPIEEHLRHSGDCGWAVIMDIQQHSSNPAEIEDPTSEKIAQARRATFNLSWPHDGKRGWVCKSEKMVDGGWYFCPTEDSEDQTSCPYCNLSLDGWEPKDDPFDEHYRRSSDCSFFVFAMGKGKKTKRGRPRKKRSSKASRVSTQSVATTTSDAPSIDLDDSMDQTTLSQSTSKGKTTKNSSKAKNSRSKRGDSVDVPDAMDVDSTDLPQPKRNARGKKRLSDSANLDEQDNASKETADNVQPPTKRRYAKSRDSASPQARGESINTYVEDTQAQDEAVAQEKKPRRGRPPKKTASSRGRKPSGNSTTSKTTSKSRVPRDPELNAVLKPDLEGEARGTDEHKPEQAGNVDNGGHPDAAPGLDQTKPGKTKPPAQGSKSNKAPDQQTVQSWTEDNMDLDLAETQTSPPFNALYSRSDPKRRESSVSVEIMSKDSGKEPVKGATKKGQKKTAGAKGKKSKKVAKTHTENSENGEEEGTERPGTGHRPKGQPADDGDMHEQQEEAQRRVSSNRSSCRTSSMAPPKTTQRYSEIPHEQQFAKSLTESLVSHTDEHNVYRNPPTGTASHAVPPLRSSPQRLSSSPQSSDAENHPPPTRDSTSRRRVLSPSQNQLAQTPQAAKTPSPAKLDANAGTLKTCRPWVPTDIEEILFGASSDKENANHDWQLSGEKRELTSPEKKMTVEQWISWNAKSGEDKLKRECERLTNLFDREGGRAMRALEGIECID